jgi:hypothetical protein
VLRPPAHTPPIAAIAAGWGWWLAYSHLKGRKKGKGGLPVLGVRFVGLKAAKQQNFTST